MLHVVQHLLVFTARDSAVITGRASRLDYAARAGGRPVAVHLAAILHRRHPPDRPRTGRTAVFVALGDIDEVALIEAPVGPTVRGNRLGNQRRDSLLAALEDLLAVEVTTFGQHCLLLFAERVSRQFRYGGEL